MCHSPASYIASSISSHHISQCPFCDARTCRIVSRRVYHSRARTRHIKYTKQLLIPSENSTSCAASHRAVLCSGVSCCVASCRVATSSETTTATQVFLPSDFILTQLRCRLPCPLNQPWPHRNTAQSSRLQEQHPLPMLRLAMVLKIVQSEGAQGLQGQAQPNRINANHWKVFWLNLKK